MDQDKNQNSSLTSYSNNWETSSLQLFLNGLYYNRGTTTTHTYYSNIDGSTTTQLNLEAIGITEATRNNNLISESTWYLGGNTYSEVYPNEIYNLERTNIVGSTIYDVNPFTINANIGLMYASDYGYGTDLTKCSNDLYWYDNEECYSNDWLFYYDDFQWLITPFSSNPDYAWYVDSTGYVNGYDVFSTSGGVRPVLYLNSELVIESEHEGTSIDPYRISVS